MDSGLEELEELESPLPSTSTIAQSSSAPFSANFISDVKRHSSDENLACDSCGKVATAQPCENACDLPSNAVTTAEANADTDDVQSKSILDLVTEAFGASALENGSNKAKVNVNESTGAGAGAGKSKPDDRSVYFDASANADNNETKLTKSALMEDVANLDDVSQVPARSESLKTEILDLSTIPKQSRRRTGRKKHLCCCCQKRKNKTKSRDMSGGAQTAGMNNNYGNNHDDDTSVQSNGLFQCLGSSTTTDESPELDDGASVAKTHRAGAARRRRIPDRPNYALSLWSILKNAVGKELTKVAMPVNFSEPLSMLQRLTEDYEYSSILDSASNCTDSCEQMCYVAAFTISSYATTAIRTGKPFNPLLGETFECDRKEDLGWKCISEQVSHHPPTAALYCEGNGWKCWQEFTMSSKFRGNYLEIVPLGIAHLTFDDGNHYTWRKVTTTVHNLVLGKLWVEQSGDMVLTNHTTGDTCNLKYIPYSMFSKKQKEVIGTVVDRNGYIQWHINGTWDAKVDAWKRKTPKKLDAKHSQRTLVDELSTGKALWVRRYPPAESERYYNFTEFACQLNEMEEGIAPTDSRLRPDQRLMEQADFDAANEEKVRLEEKQRAARKRWGGDETYYRPVWFSKEKDPVEGSLIHVFKGEYWNCKTSQDWKRCPDIF